MGKKVFVGWQIWEKLVFILACAMVVTVFLGCIKLVYTHWRLRKYSAVAEKEKKEQPMQRHMSQRQRRLGSVEVPFGIRAIESGIEVEGVWISRANTPESASKDVSANSSIWEHVPMKGREIDVERQDAHQGLVKSASDRSATTAGPARPSFDQAVSAEILTGSNGSRDSSPDHIITKPSRSRHPPLSYTRYSCNPYVLRQSPVINTLEGLEAIHRASTSITGHQSDDSPGSNNSSNRSSSKSTDIEPISASAASLLSGQQASRPMRSSSSDMELLNSHRISQAAETGQFTPRGRRPGQSHSVDFTSTGRPSRASLSMERRADSKVQSSATQSPTGQGKAGDMVSTSDPDASKAPTRRSSMPAVVPFTQFCKTVSRDTRPESLRSSSLESSRPASEGQSVYDSAPASPIIPASTGAAELARLPPVKESSSFEKRASQMLRGHGTGFEILLPGSLNPPAPKEHSMDRQRPAPPIALHNFSRTRDTSVENRRKLQKMRRPSNESTASSDTSRWSRISLF